MNSDIIALAELAASGRLSLAETRDFLTSAPLDAWVEDTVLLILRDHEQESAGAGPLQRLRQLLDDLRDVPAGPERILKTNTLVRTLGQPDRLAVLLDALRLAYSSPNDLERAIALESLSNRRHSSYGWLGGGTNLVNSSRFSAAGTSPPRVDDLLERFRGYPLPWWMLSAHIWIPATAGRAFPSGKAPEPALAIEPPHSHPFCFASHVVVGTIHQSIYVPADEAEHQIGRYSTSPLIHTDHVWPPHSESETARLAAVEHRVSLNAGTSYYLDSGAVHDVDIDRATARTHPTISLFLATEAVEMPYSYIAPSMFEFHEAHPDLDRRPIALTHERWSAKLEAVAAYLRDLTTGLDLEPIIEHDAEYAFMHE